MRPFESREVRGLRGKTQLPRTGEMSLETLLGRELFDEVNGVVVNAIEAIGPLDAVATDQCEVADRSASRAHSSVSAGSPPSKAFLLEQGHGGPFLRGVDCCG